MSEPEPSVRPYRLDKPADREALWALKRDFETALGAGTGTETKRAAYESKLTDEYRRRWLGWVERCVAEENCVLLADAGASAVGYVFVLPERLAFVWDAAVVNELYVAPGYRGTTVADTLIGTAVDLAREQDLPLNRLLLDVDPDNERACAFYERHGFQPWGEIVARKL